MAMCRSVAGGGQVKLPLEGEADELQMLRARLPEAKVLASMPANAKEYGV